LDPCSSLNDSLQSSIISNNILNITPKYKQEQLISDWVNQPMYCPIETITPDLPKMQPLPPKKEKEKT
jgi:hypothetical protein